MALLPYHEIKSDFPILATTMNGKPLVFLDSAASSQKPRRVIDVFEHYYRCRNANIHRGAYRLSYEATDLFDRTRSRLARFLNAPREESIIFTRNTTEGINLVASSWGDANVGEGDEIVITELEHHSNMVPWMMLASRKGAKIRYLPLTSDQRIDYSALDQVIGERTKMVAIAHMSNAVGTIHDLKRIQAAASRVGAKFLVDGAQGAPHIYPDVQALDCDFYAFSGHKMCGPSGVGALYGRYEILKDMPPYMGGGDMILSVTRDGFKPAPLPAKFEAGTPNIEGTIAWALAIDYLEEIGIEKIHEHEVELTKMTITELEKIPGVRLFGTKEWQWRGGIVSFIIDGVHPHDIGSILDAEGVAVRAGHHCCEPFMRSCNISGTVRASFYLYNGPEDVEALVRGVQRVTEIFKPKEKEGAVK